MSKAENKQDKSGQVAQSSINNNDKPNNDQAMAMKAIMDTLTSLTAAVDKIKIRLDDNERRPGTQDWQPDEPSLARPGEPGMARPFNPGMTRPFERANRPDYPFKSAMGPSYDRPSSYGYGPASGPVKIHLERYTGLGTKTLPASWMRSYEAMSSLHNWSDHHKLTMLRFYLADEAVTWFDNQITQGMGTLSWSEIKDRFERYFSQDKVVTPKMVLTKEWDPKTTTFYEHYKEMLRLFEISGLQDSWRVKVLKTSLPPYYVRMCSIVETADADEWYQRAASIISSLPKYEAKTGGRSQLKTMAPIPDIKALARRAPIDKHDKTEDPSKCLFCSQINPNHKLDDCFCHPRKLKAAMAKRNIHMITSDETDNLDLEEDILTEEDLEEGDEPVEMNALTELRSSEKLETIGMLSGVSNQAKMTLNKVTTVKGLIDSGASVSAISEDLCSEWNIKFRPHKKDLAQVQGSFSTKGVAFIDVQIGPYQGRVKAYVLDSPPYPFILGIKEFKTFGISWDYPYLITEETDRAVVQLESLANEDTP